MGNTSAIDLTPLDWTLSGWRPNAWLLGRSMETGWGLRPETGPVPAPLPCSVQGALRTACVIPDYLVGVNSRQCEWVANRHWEFSTLVILEKAGTWFLEAESLEYSGWVVVNGRLAGDFKGARTPHRIDLTAVFQTGENRLSLVFDCPPADQGQYGYTVQSKYFASRWAYSWDWCPRIVPVGIGGMVRLVPGDSLQPLPHIRTSWDVATESGTVQVQLSNLPPTFNGRMTVKLERENSVLLMVDQNVTGEMASVARHKLPVEPWWPNGQGKQPLYRLNILLQDADSTAVWTHSVQVGFKCVEWYSCANAPVGATPWICTVNGRDVFLQGVNWTPVRVPHLDACLADYETLLDLYQEMGVNCLRVWGGAGLETETFYAGCDARGLMVWQEFPLSSSGLDNWPPEDAAAIAELERIAQNYIERRGHHASLFMWCGGNELQGARDGGKVGIGRPCDISHPALKAMGDVVARLDPERRYLPNSASGPRFNADAAEFGLGLHHDVHDPCGVANPEWREYWQRDDALMRSEVACASAADVEMLLRHATLEELWPPTGTYWEHSTPWWAQWDRFEAIFAGTAPEVALAAYVSQTQREQAEFHGTAAAASKARFNGEHHDGRPRCGGYLVWMGHDCFPCPANTSLIDAEGRPKPAFYALKGVFTSNK